MSSPIKDTPPTFAEQQMLEKQRRYSQLLEDEGSDEIAGYTLTLEGCAPVVVRHDVSTQHTLSWDPVKSKSGDVILESGLCNLYIFPKVTLDDDNDAVDYLGLASDEGREEANDDQRREAAHHPSELRGRAGHAEALLLRSRLRRVERLQHEGK